MSIAQSIIDCQVVGIFKDRVVWLLKGASGASVVLKSERIATVGDPSKQIRRKNSITSIQFMNELYIACTENFADLRILNDIELNYILGDKMIRQLLGMQEGARIEEAARTDLREECVFYVMEFIKNMVTADGLIDIHTQRLSLNSQQRARGGHVSPVQTMPVQSYKKQMSNPECFVGLGKIFSVDMFLGNRDRISHHGTEWEVSNIGNIFLRMSDDGQRVGFSGIDFWDNTSPFADLNADFSIQETQDQVWPGRYLADDQRENRGRIAKMLIKSLVDRMNRIASSPEPNKVANSIKDAHAQALADGMELGIESLKQALGSFQQSGKLPKSVKHRMKVLNWGEKKSKIPWKR